jgi:uncharacterized BrkB/YihY/UPF0761 family membrane protein
VLQRFFADQCPQQAAAIAYRVLFSTAPLAIILVSIFGLLLQDDSLREDVVDAIVDALPVTVAGRQDVEDAITAIATPASAAGVVSLIVFGWAATSPACPPPSAASRNVAPETRAWLRRRA